MAGRPAAVVRSAIAAGNAAALEAIRDPSMRRVQVSYLLGFVADTALFVLVSVRAYGAAGPVGVAGAGAARMLAAMVFGALAAAPLARWRPDRVLIALSIVRGLAALVAIVAIDVGGGLAWLFAIAAMTGATDALLRPAQSTLLPALARTPAELIRSNVASSTSEALGTFAGPALVAASFAIGLPAIAALGVAGAQAVGVIALAGVHFESEHDARGPVRTSQRGLAIAPGLAAIRRRPGIGLVIAGFAVQTFVRGLLSTMVVVLSVTLVGLGEAGVGLLGAAMGLGAFAGIAAGLAIQRSSPVAFALALAGWGAPLAVIGVVPLPVVALLAFAAIGLSNALLDIVGFTLLQRGCRNEERASVFAIFEGTVGLSATLGCVIAPVLINVLGAREALVATGLSLPFAAVALWLFLRRRGDVALLPAEVIERLRRVPSFAVLPLTGIERLVSSAVRVSFRTGEVLMRKGDPADCFLVIESGELEVTDGARVLNVVGPGVGVGEIALLRGGPRTATVTALTDGSADAFDPASFLAAVSGPAASAAATWVIEEHLARSAAAG